MASIYKYKGYKIVKKPIPQLSTKKEYYIVKDYKTATITGILDYFNTLKEAKSYIDGLI